MAASAWLSGGRRHRSTHVCMQVKALKELDTPTILVATSDRDLSDSLSGTTIVSCHALLRELARVWQAPGVRLPAMAAGCACLVLPV